MNIRKEWENWKFKTIVPNGSIRFNVEIIQARMRSVRDLIMMIKLIRERESPPRLFQIRLHFFLSPFFPFSLLATSTTVISLLAKWNFSPDVNRCRRSGGDPRYLPRELSHAFFLPSTFTRPPVRGPISRGNSPSTVSRIRRRSRGETKQRNEYRNSKLTCVFVAKWNQTTFKLTRGSS